MSVSQSVFSNLFGHKSYFITPITILRAHLGTWTRIIMKNYPKGERSWEIGRICMAQNNLPPNHQQLFFFKHLLLGPTLVLVVQSLSHVQLFVTPLTCQAPLSLSIYQSVLKFMFVQSVMPSNHFILCCPLLHLPSIFPSVRVFPKKLPLCIRWSKYCSFSTSPSNEYSGLISFRTD